MGKWADYLVSGIKYSDSGYNKQLSELYIQIDEGASAGSLISCSKAEIIKMIEQGCSFITIHQIDEEIWEKGKPIKRIEIGDQIYLRTDSNNLREDNLGNFV